MSQGHRVDGKKSTGAAQLPELFPFGDFPFYNIYYNIYYCSFLTKLHWFANTAQPFYLLHHPCYERFTSYLGLPTCPTSTAPNNSLQGKYFAFKNLINKAFKQCANANYLLVFSTFFSSKERQEQRKRLSKSAVPTFFKPAFDSRHSMVGIHYSRAFDRLLRGECILLECP